MRYPLPSLPALHAFEAAARLGSFTAAAEELHLSPSTVSHRIRGLEAELGFALFERLARSVRLTDLGKAYLPVVRAVFDELTSATIGLFGSPGGGRVTVRVPVSYGVAFLAPRLARFTARHDVRVWVVSEIWGDEGPDLEIDLEVTFQDERLGTGAGEVLGGERALLVGNPAARAGPGVRGDGEAARVLVLGYERLWQGLDRPPSDGVRTGPDITVDTWSGALELVAETPGHHALAPALLAARAIESGRLVRVEDVAVPMREVYRLARPDRPAAPSSEATRFVEWLRAEHRTTD